MKTLKFMKNNIITGSVLECLASLVIGFVVVLVAYKQISLILAICAVVSSIIICVISYRWFVRFAGTRNLPVYSLVRPKNVVGLFFNNFFMDMCGMGLSTLCTAYYINRGADMGFYLAILLVIVFFCMFIPKIINYAMPSESLRRLIIAVDDSFQDVTGMINEKNIS